MFYNLLIFLIKKIVAILVSIACVFTSSFYEIKKTPIEPIDSENINLSFATLSDIHMTDSGFRQFILDLALNDIEQSQTKLDALVLAGDNTDFGQIEEYERLSESLMRKDFVDNMIIANGNHDTWTEEGIYDLAEDYFINYVNKITGNDIENEYYSKKVNGYTFIVLGSQIRRTMAYFEQEQIDWFANEMELASKDGKPIFVVCHWPLNQTHGLTGSFENGDIDSMDFGIGEQSDLINDIMQKYDNVFFISGHLHYGFANENTSKLYKYQSIEKVGNIISINLPSLMYFTLNGKVVNGTGFVFEVYDNEVVIRARNYITGVWFDEYSQTIELS